MKKIYLLLIVSIYCYNSGIAQSQIIYNETVDQSFLIKSNSNDNSVKKHIFTRLAQAGRKQVSAVRINFNFKLKKEILRNNNKLEFIVSMTNIRLTGDTRYKGYDLSEFLMPENISFTLDWLKGSSVINNFAFNNVSVSGNTVKLVNMTVNDSTDYNNYSIKLKNKQFVYTFKNKQNFDTKISYIDDYQRENTIVNNKLKVLNEISTDRNVLSQLVDFSILEKYRDSAVNAINYFNDVRKKPFYSNLNINSNDPLKLRQNLSNLKNKAESVNRVTSSIIDNLDEVYYNRGMKDLEKQRFNVAEANFNKSLRINPNYINSHLQLARLYYKKGNVDQTVDKLFEIKGMNPDQQVNRQVVEFARGIYNDFIIDARNLNNRARFDEAINVITRAGQICRDFHEIQCQSNMDREMSRAVNGQYGLMLRDIDNNFNLNNLNEAEKIIGIALDFANKNRQFIPNNSQISQRLSDLYFSYINRGNNLNSKRSYESAVLEFDQAYRVCENYQEIHCTEDLDKGYFNSRTGIYNNLIYNTENLYKTGKTYEAEKLIDEAILYRENYKLNRNTGEERLLLDIKKSVYSIIISEGREFSKNKKFNDALQRFEEAKKLENSYSFYKNKNLDFYIKESAKGLVLNILEDGKHKVSLNDLKSARTLYKESRLLVTKYKLENDKSIINASEELRSKIFKQECENAQNKYTAHYNKAKEQIRNKKFLEADATLNNALSVSKEFEDCAIDVSLVVKERNLINDVVNYLNMKKKVNDLINRRNYKQAIENYKTVSNFYVSNNIKNFGLNHDELFDFIRQHNASFIIYAVGFYSYNKEFESSLSLLKELSRRGSKNKYSKDAQISLGNDLATYDFDKNPNSNYQSNIARHTSGDKYFKYFMKAYKKQWKNLK